MKPTNSRKISGVFESKGCTRRPSDVLVPRWDPSVLFTPAGMNQFKDHFLGKCKLDFTRATTCQKCLRTGDIDNVGRTAYHHTFFEMLGNFSFGDYFKRDAINWAWEFLTARSGSALTADRLTVSVYLDDDEAAEIWTDDIKLPPSGSSGWARTTTSGPPAPRPKAPTASAGRAARSSTTPTAGGEVEIWNLVFTQFNRVGSPPNNLRRCRARTSTPAWAWSATAAVLARRRDRTSTSTSCGRSSKRPPRSAARKYDPASENGRRLRRITDHVRACTFAIHENVYPGPNKQKYVIKPAAAPRRARRPSDGRAQPFLYQAGAGRGRDDEAALSRTGRNGRTRGPGDRQGGGATSSPRSTPAWSGSIACSA